MHIILLKFSDNKSAASQFMAEHNTWIAEGFSEGVFQCVGSLDTGGGFILAHGEEHAAIVERVNDDPFVKNGVVKMEVHEIDLKRTVPELAHLVAKTTH